MPKDVNFFAHIKIQFLRQLCCRESFFLPKKKLFVRRVFCLFLGWVSNKKISSYISDNGFSPGQASTIARCMEHIEHQVESKSHTPVEDHKNQWHINKEDTTDYCKILHQRVGSHLYAGGRHKDSIILFHI